MYTVLHIVAGPRAQTYSNFNCPVIATLSRTHVLPLLLFRTLNQDPCPIIFSVLGQEVLTVVRKMCNTVYVTHIPEDYLLAGESETTDNRSRVDFTLDQLVSIL